MKITLEIKPKDLEDVMRLSGEKRSSAALQKFRDRRLQLSRRREVLDKFLTGEWGAEGARALTKNFLGSTLRWRNGQT